MEENTEIMAEDILMDNGEEAAEDIGDNSAEDRVRTLEDENMALKRQLFFLGKGISGEAAEVISPAAEKLMSEMDISFEEAAEEIVSRLAPKSDKSSCGLTTGVRITDIPRDNDSALRRAFGLKK
ncbi:MAG: hypothetical protein ACI4JJ_05260 [Huintestinicola sp.]